MEYWSIGVMRSRPNTPSLQYSNYFPLSDVGENSDEDFLSLKRGARGDFGQG
jgi:hypothetical protein